MSVAFFGQGMTNLGWTVISDVAPKEFIGLTAGIFNFSANLAGIVTPLVIGYAYQSTGSFVGPLVYIGVVALIGAFSYSVILGDIHRLDCQPVMNPDLRVQIEKYIESLFVAPDPVLTETSRRRRGGPAADPGVAEPGEAALPADEDERRPRVLEIGTLGGYSTTWLARALPEVDRSPASSWIRSTPTSRERMSIARAWALASPSTSGPAEQTLQRLIEQRVPTFDLIFIDADKPGYPRYLDLSLQLSRPGTVILADNLIRDGGVMDAAPEEENARAARAFNAMLAADSTARVDHHSRPREEDRRDVDLDRQIVTGSNGNL